MNRTDMAIIELAAAFCDLKRHNEKLYINALHSLVNLAISEEKIKRISLIEADIQRVSQVLINARQPQFINNDNSMNHACRRKAERRSSKSQGN